MARIIGPKSKYKAMLKKVRELEPGKAQIARKGIDFECEVYSFTNVVYAAANTRGLAASVAVFPDEGTGCVVFAFYRADSYLRPNMQAYPIVRKMRRWS